MHFVCEHLSLVCQHLPLTRDFCVNVKTQALDRILPAPRPSLTGTHWARGRPETMQEQH